MENVMQVRVTGILIEDEKVLLVKQKVANRNWSLRRKSREWRNVRGSNDSRNERRDRVRS